MRTLHDITALLLIAVNTGIAAWGLAFTARAAASAWFRQGVALAQTLVIAQGLIGIALLFGDAARPDDPLHTRVYGPFMVVAILAAWGFAGEDQRRNTQIFAATSAIIALLGARALFTA